MRRVRRSLFPMLVLATALLVVAVAVSACGDTGPDPRGVDRASGAGALARALAATRAVPNGRVEVTTVLVGLGRLPDPPPGGDRMTMVVHRASFDRSSRRVAVETDMSAVAEILGPDSAGPAGDLSVPARMIADGDVVYAQGGSFARAVGRTPDDWVQLDRSRLDGRQPRSDTADLLLDPLAPLAVADETVGDVRVVGQERVRGVPVTHLRARVRVGGPADGERNGASGHDSSDGARVLAPLGVWIDADGVIRRLELRLDPPIAGGAGGVTGAGEVVTTVELFDLGSAAISPPTDRPERMQNRTSGG